ncbi:MAG: bifunctional folylpolyglutamate synthase/dihydrofolate synthase [Thermoplasmata archaeon]|nr:folylpolyglutamate synthase/dihydrofolate synthase family protein [Thermoplasmata archaeon]
MVQNMNNGMDELEYLYSLSRFGVKLGLDVMYEFSSRIGNPQDSFKSLHITGTNGKGSTSAMLYTIIKSKYRAGLYTSPHIERFNERIIALDKEIEDEFMKDWIREKRKIIEIMAGEGNQPTFFEVTTAMAFDYFKHKNIQTAIIEVGLGGRLDATNIIKSSVSGIVTISLEHTDRLGNTLSQIAFEKGGIIKKNTPVVVGENKDEPLKVLENLAKERNAPFYNINDLYEVSDVEINLNGTKFKAKKDDKIYDVKIPLIGRHQIKNALVAITMAEIFDPKLDYKNISNVKFPGRFEIKSEKPLIITDAAHNPEAAESLVKTVKELFTRRPLIVATQLKDKNSIEFFRRLGEIADHIIVTEVKEDRRKDAEILAQEARMFIDNVQVQRDSNKAFEMAINESDFIIVTGSLYLLGEFEEWFKKKSF